MELHNGQQYTWSGTLLTATPIGDGWWQLTDLQGRIISIAPDGTFYQGEVAGGIDGGYYAIGDRIPNVTLDDLKPQALGLSHATA